MKSEVAQCFARAPYFMVSTGGIENFTLLENTARNLGSTAGIETAEMLIHSGIDVLTTGNLGARASETLEGAGIRVHAGCSGKVSEAFSKCLSGKLTETKGASYSGCLESPGTSKVQQ